MYSLSAIDTFHIKEPVNTYIYDVLPIYSGLAILSSDNLLHLLDPHLLSERGGVVRKLKGAGHGVTCFTALKTMEHVVAVAGRDGMIKLWDLRSGDLAGSISAGENTAVISITSSSSTYLAGGSELTNHEASIFIWDIRQLSKPPLIKLNKSHSDDITEVRYHPHQSNLLLSGSTDGLVNMYNTSILDEEDSLYQTINHGASIHQCDFLSDSDIFALSHDEKFSIYKLGSNNLLQKGENVISNQTKNDIHFGDMRERFGGEYVAKVIVGRPDGNAVMGIGTHSKEMFELIQLKNNPPSTWKFSSHEKVSLIEAHGSEIIRSFCFLDNLKTIFTCGEDGQLKAWKGE